MKAHHSTASTSLPAAQRYYLIIGADTDIGAAFARLFHADRIRLLLVGATEATRELARSMGQLAFVRRLKDHDDLEALKRYVTEHQIMIDGVIHTAAASTPMKAATILPDEAKALLHQQMTLPILLTRYFLADMLTLDRGRIIHAIRRTRDFSNCAQSGLATYNETLADELASTNLAVTQLTVPDEPLSPDQADQLVRQALTSCRPGDSRTTESVSSGGRRRFCWGFRSASR
ncbi:MAG: SDR family NAD(P)-dependent oxidoreductase [Verrucomicrobia bacterium]|nr:SDR family NAD(P)-dependent oxidoreductase [Verrucomicrobiota bacterium]